MKDSSASNPKHTSARKAAANRRNAQKSTGPRTARGKSYSRLNSLKHGILASQAVLSAVEGRENRAAFAQTVDGLAADFEPVGTFEQMLVQKIATCFWRFRRLLRFENRAALQSYDDRTYDAMNHRERWRQPLYVEQDGPNREKRKLDRDDVLERAGLGLDLPNEHDLQRLVRYENSIERTLSKALAQLKAHQKARREAAKASASQHPAPSYEDREVVVDRKASARNAEARIVPLGAKAGFAAHEQAARAREREAAELQAALEAEEAEATVGGIEIDQTNPNILEDPKEIERQQVMIEAADRILKLSASLEPTRREPGK